MHRTQIYLTEEEHKRIRVLATQTGRKQSEIIRDAIDDYLAKAPLTDPQRGMRRAQGLWKDRDVRFFRQIRTDVERRFEHE